MIKLTDVNKIYDNNVYAIKNINVSINKGEFVFLVGSSGSGKSSFIKMLLKEVEPTNGEIIVDGTKLNDLKEKLKLATGINVNNYTFDDRLNYEKLKLDGDLESYIDDKISIITKYDRELADLLEDAVDDMKDDDLDDLEMPDKDKFYNIPKTDSEGNVIGNDFNTTEYNTARDNVLSAYKGYLDAKKGSESASAGVNIKEKRYKNMLRSNYSNILAMEDGIDQLITNIDIANKSLANTKLQYQLGLMTTNDYNTAATGYRQLDISLRQTLNQYYQLKIVFEKPWAVSSSSSAGQ